MTTGWLTSFNLKTGYGWITPDEGGPDVYFHSSNLPLKFRRYMHERVRLSFDVVHLPKYKNPQARNVTLENECHAHISHTEAPAQS